MKKKSIFIISISLFFLCLYFLYSPSNKDVDKTLLVHKIEPSNPPVTSIAKNETPQIEQALTQSIKSALDDYAEKMRFPSYSVPINSYDWNILNPRALEIKPKPLFNDEGFIADLDHVKVIVDVHSFVVDLEQDLPVQVKAVYDNENKSPGLEMVSVAFNSSNNPYDRGNMEQISLDRSWQSEEDEPLNNELVYKGIIPSTLLQTYGESNVHLVAQLAFSDGSEATTGIALKLFKSAADLASIGQSYIEGPHLMIPVDLTAHSPGFFRIQGNLFDEDGEQAIALLTEEIQTDTEGIIGGVFKVHIATLKELGHEGPYLFRDLHISKIPTKPDYRPGYGSHEKNSYTVDGFDFAEYSDEEYVNPEMEKRLAALKRISEN